MKAFLKFLPASWIPAEWAPQERNRIAKTVGIGGVMILCGATLWYGYGVYRRHQAAKAWSACAGVLDLYDRALRGQQAAEGEPSVWIGVAQAAKQAAQSYAGQSIEPFLYLMAGQAALMQGDRAAACEAFGRSYDVIPSASSYAPLISLQYALAQIDSDNPEVAAAGDRLLTQLSEDKGNDFQAAALYYRGFIKWVAQDRAGAELHWAQLARVARGSVWARRAYEHLNVTE